MTEPVIRRALIADVPAIIALLADDEVGRTRDDPALPLDARYPQAFEAIDKDPGELLGVLVEAGEVIGCAQVSFAPGLSNFGSLRGQIGSVRVRSDRRGQGLGGQLIAWAIAECRSRGCGSVSATSGKSRTDAHRFYVAHGFIASHEGLKLKL